MRVTAPGDPLAPLLDLPGVAAAVADARAAVDKLLSHRVLRRRSAEVTAESALRGARASAQLEGAGTELERLRGQLLAGGTVTLARRPDGSPDERGARLVEGAVRLHADLGQVLASWRHSPRQALARMHVVAAGDLGLDPDELGRPRAVGQACEDPLGLGAPPDPLEVSARLDGLSRVVLATKVPAVVVSAVVHGELLALRAFGSADGLVARAAARLVLVDRGLDPKAVSAPEVGHVELHHEYEEAARAYVGGGPAGVATWVAHCASAVALGAREGVAVCEAILREAPPTG
ncbi:MAG: filamentation induced by cAMP protein Fic [Frankiales bacterium]|nr:filamentation induced by cAMP protein Fic [Frankiales bacterium]